MKIVSWVDPLTNESLEETDTHLIHKDTKYPIINGVPKFVKENSGDPQYDIEKCDRCENIFYDKYLTFCNKEKQILCDRCYYYNFRQYENEKTEYIHNKQN